MPISRTEIILSLQRASLGEIFSNVKGIAYKYDALNKYFMLRFYLENEPTEDDYDSLSCIMGEFIADYNHCEFEVIKEECIYVEGPLNSAHFEGVDIFFWRRFGP